MKQPWRRVEDKTYIPHYRFYSEGAIKRSPEGSPLWRVSVGILQKYISVLVGGKRLDCFLPLAMTPIQNRLAVICRRRTGRVQRLDTQLDSGYSATGLKGGDTDAGILLQM
jgi:hypothetical protein